MLDEFLKATLPNPIVLDFSTQPAWMYNGSWGFPQDPRAVDWHYSDAPAPYANTTTHLAEYFGRFASWLVSGWFLDEFGKNITGGPALGDKLTHWEVFNEPEGCHGIDPPMYNAEYDAIVTAIRKQTQSKMKFVGLALEQIEAVDYVQQFLNRSLHAPGVPLDYFSFHRYSLATSRTDPASWEKMIVPGIAKVMTQLCSSFRVRQMSIKQHRWCARSYKCAIELILLCSRRWTRSAPYCPTTTSTTCQHRTRCTTKRRRRCLRTALLRTLRWVSTF
jgi:hypothetical protein